MRTFLKLTSACLILGIVLQGTALAQSAGAQTFGAESYPYATEAQNLQRANDHKKAIKELKNCLLYTSPSPRDRTRSRMPSSA